MKKLLIALVAVSTISTVALAGCQDGKGKGPKEGKKDGPNMVISKKMMENLPQEQKDAIKAILEKKSGRDKMKSLMEQKKAIISAEKFDKAAYIKNADAIEDLRENMKDDRVKTNAEILSVLTPEQRKKIADKMTEKAEKMKKHREDKKQK